MAKLFTVWIIEDGLMSIVQADTEDEARQKLLDKLQIRKLESEIEVDEVLFQDGVSDLRYDVSDAHLLQEDI